MTSTPAADLLHSDDELASSDAAYQGIAKRPELPGTAADLKVAMRHDKHRALPDTPVGGLQDLIEFIKALIRSKIGQPSRVIEQ